MSYEYVYRLATAASKNPTIKGGGVSVKEIRFRNREQNVKLPTFMDHMICALFALSRLRQKTQPHSPDIHDSIEVIIHF